MMPGGDHNVQKKIETSPINHLHQWEEMMRVTDLIPKGNILTPKPNLQVEWFYITFHKSDRTEYMQSEHKLQNKMLQTLAEYFQSIHKTCENDGSLQRLLLKIFQAEAKRKLRCKQE
jgi:hypothetical protein